MDGEKSREMIETIKYYSPKKVLEYVFKNNLIDLPGWEWVYQFLQADEQLIPYRIERMATRKEVKFKFGIEVANSPKHALEIDLGEGNNLWKQAIQAELD